MRKNSNILLLVITSLLLVLGIALNFMQWNTLRDEKIRVEEAQQELDLAQSRLLAMMALEKNKDRLNADYDVVMGLLPSSPSEDGIIRDIQSGADLSGMHFVFIRFGERVKGEGYEEMPVSLSFEGKYHQVLHFLDYLQVYERAVRIDELRVDQSSSDAEKMMVSIVASAFYAEE